MELLPKSEALSRLESVQLRIREAEADAFFILQNPDLYYFAGTVQTGLLCIPASGEPLYLVQKSVARAKMESPWEHILPLESMKKVPEVLAAEVPGLHRVGLELDVLPANHYFRLQKQFPGTEFIDASPVIRELRMIKSSYEVHQMRRAALMLRDAYSALPGWVRPGVTELEVVARMEGFLRLQGHQGLIRMRGFNLEIGYGTLSAGSSAAYPTYFPGPVGFTGLYPAIPNAGSKHRLLEGQTLMADVCGGYGGYLVDKTRIVAVGELPPEMTEAHRFVLTLMAEVEEMLKPSTPCSEIGRHVFTRVADSPYRSHFMGLGDSQVRFVGHGLGLELDELPVITEKNDQPLQPGMTIAIEPKIFFPDHGGVGIENTYLITENGFENLTPFPEEILRAG
jgi:Xaa-Pro aminopeptidase